MVTDAAIPYLRRKMTVIIGIVLCGILSASYVLLKVPESCGDTCY